MRGVKIYIGILLLLVSYPAFAQNPIELVRQDLELLQTNWVVVKAREKAGPRFIPRKGDIPVFGKEYYQAAFQHLYPEEAFVLDDLTLQYLSLYSIEERGASEILLGLENLYFPIIEKALKAEGLPEQLKYLPVALSALNSEKISPTGATGIWQLRHPVAKKQGLISTFRVDERRDPAAASIAAARSLKSLHEQYQDWPLTILAYVNGPSVLNRAMIRCNCTKPDSIGPFLPIEGREILQAFTAIALISKGHKSHQIYPLSIDQPKSELLIPGYESDLISLSLASGLPVVHLRSLNPAYRTDTIPAKCPLGVKLPSNLAFSPAITLAKSISIRDSISRLTAKAPEPKPEPTAVISQTQATEIQEQPKNTQLILYSVLEGDYLGTIAEKFNVDLMEVMSWNGLRSDLIYAGDKLKIYVPESQQQAAARRGKSLSKAKNHVSNTSGKKYEYYIVQSGDTLWDIAQKYPGVSYQDILDINGISEAIYPGQKLKIKKID